MVANEDMNKKEGSSEGQPRQRLARSMSSNALETSKNKNQMSSANVRPKPMSKAMSTLSDSILFENKVVSHSTRTEKIELPKSAYRRTRKLSASETTTNRTAEKQERIPNDDGKRLRAAPINGSTSLRRTKGSNSLSAVSRNSSNSTSKEKRLGQDKLPLVLNSWSGGNNGETNGPVNNRLIAMQERKQVIDNYLRDMRSRTNLQGSDTATVHEEEIHGLTEERSSPRSSKGADIKPRGRLDFEEDKDGDEIDIPKLALEKLDENDSEITNKSKTNAIHSKGWSLLRKKLIEVKEETKPAEKVASTEEPEKQSTANYLKMLRERLRQCQPAEIIASSDVNEIAKRKQDLERRRSLSGMPGKKSFFETVLTAHALAKQGKMTSRSTDSGRRTSRSGPPSLSRHSLPDISSNKMKFHCSPHFQKTLRMMEKNDLLIKEEETASAQERPQTLASRYSM